MCSYFNYKLVQSFSHFLLINLEDREIFTLLDSVRGSVRGTVRGSVRGSVRLGSWLCSQFGLRLRITTNVRGRPIDQTQRSEKKLKNEFQIVNHLDQSYVFLWRIQQSHLSMYEA